MPPLYLPLSFQTTFRCIVPRPPSPPMMRHSYRSHLLFGSATLGHEECYAWHKSSTKIRMPSNSSLPPTTPHIHGHYYWNTHRHRMWDLDPAHPSLFHHPVSMLLQSSGLFRGWKSPNHSPPVGSCIPSTSTLYSTFPPSSSIHIS